MFYYNIVAHACTHTHIYIYLFCALVLCLTLCCTPNFPMSEWVLGGHPPSQPQICGAVMNTNLLCLSSTHGRGERERLFSFSRDSFRQIMFFLWRFFMWMFTECLSFTIPLCLFSFFCSHSLYLLSSSFNCGSSLTGMTRMSFGKLIWMWWMLFSPVSLTTFNLTMHITFSFWIPSMT